MTTPSTPTGEALIARLEAAEVGSRELDHLIGELTDAPIRSAGDVVGLGYDRFTTSLDAALALAERVLPGCEWEVIKLDAGCVARMGDPTLCMEGEAETPPLALCAAVLQALRATGAAQ